MNELKIGTVQADLVWENKEANLSQLTNLIQSQPNPVDLIVLPEMFSTGFSMNPINLAEDLDGPTLYWMRKIAVDQNCLLVGSLIVHEGGQYYNRFIAVDPTGILAQYNKRHLFRMASEENHYEPGIDRVVFEWKGWRILPQICYDLRFPVWIRNQDDYDLAIFVANWPKARAEVWNVLLRARALENQSYVIGVNRIGLDNNGIDHAGDSQVVSPKGQLISSLGQEEACGVATLDLNALKSFRSKFPAHLDRDLFDLKD